MSKQGLVSRSILLSLLSSRPPCAVPRLPRIDVLRSQEALVAVAFSWGAGKVSGAFHSKEEVAVAFCTKVIIVLFPHAKRGGGFVLMYVRDLWQLSVVLGIRDTVAPRALSDGLTGPVGSEFLLDDQQ